jgi:hypothetical protein
MPKKKTTKTNSDTIYSSNTTHDEIRDAKSSGDILTIDENTTIEEIVDNLLMDGTFENDDLTLTCPICYSELDTFQGKIPVNLVNKKLSELDKSKDLEIGIGTMCPGCASSITLIMKVERGNLTFEHVEDTRNKGVTKRQPSRRNY